MIKKLILNATALAVLSLPVLSQAKPPPIPDEFFDTEMGDFVVFTGLIFNPAAFTDSFSFKTTGTSTNVVVDLSSIDVAPLTLSLTEGATTIPLGTSTGSDGTAPMYGTGSWVDTFLNLSPGTYTLHISDSVSGPSFGAFGGAVELVSAVPEPGTWAAMLAGLVMMVGFVAQRRHMPRF